MANIVINGNFDAGLSDWLTETSNDGGVSWFPSGDINLDPSQGIGGTNCAQYVLTLGPLVRLKQESIAVMEGQSYALQYYARRDNNVPEAGIANVFVIYQAGTNTVIYQSSPSLATLTYSSNGVIFTVPPGVTKIDLVIEANYFEFAPQPSPKEAFYVDEISIIQYLVCYSGRSIAMSRDVETGEEGWVRVDCLDPARHLVFNTASQEYVKIERVVKAGRTNRFFLFRKGCLNGTKPNEDFYITAGHKVLYNGVETKVRDMPHRKRKNLKWTEDVYTLVCQDHCPLLINGMEVMTYGLDEWQQARTCLLSANLEEY